MPSTASPRALAEDSNAAERKELLDALETRRKLVDSRHRNDRAVVPVERVLAFIAAVTNLVLEVVKDRKDKLLFLEKLRALTGRRTAVVGIDPPAEP